MEAHSLKSKNPHIFSDYIPNKLQHLSVNYYQFLHPFLHRCLCLYSRLHQMKYILNPHHISRITATIFMRLRQPIAIRLYKNRSCRPSSQIQICEINWQSNADFTYTSILTMAMLSMPFVSRSLSNVQQCLPDTKMTLFTFFGSTEVSDNTGWNDVPGHNSTRLETAAGWRSKTLGPTTMSGLRKFRTT